MENQPPLKSIYIVAVGGQGSIVLTDWIFNAAHLEGYVAQSVGLPGLSQRGGATSFYIELVLSRDPGEQRVVFGHFPVPGQVDIIMAQEFLELGRALERGYGSPRTAIIASTHRVFSLAERMPASGGPARDEDIHRLVKEFSGSFIGFNALELARKNGLDEVAVNALLLGALAAAGLLPISADAYTEAVRQTGIAVEANLRAFALGRDFVASGRHLLPPPAAPEEAQERRVEELSQRLPMRQRSAYLSLVRDRVAALPRPLQPVLAEGVFQLIDYQGQGYALEYLGRVEAMVAQDRPDDYRLSQLYAASLASLMGYEDIVQVARLKTRRERFTGLRQGLGVGRGQVYEVADYFSPDAEELLGILPPRLSGLLSRLVLRGKKPGVLRYRSPTTSFPGFLLLKLLAWLRFLRPASQRRRREGEWWQEYQEAVAAFAGRDYELGCLVARSGQMVKGYGAIRRRNLEAVRRFLHDILQPLADREAALGTGGYPVTLRVGEHARSLILQGEAGLERAERLARWALGRLETGEGYQEALRLLSAPAPPNPTQ